jgi:hypothetical protein
MTYPGGGGLSAAGRARREKVRLQAAEWFVEGVTPPEVARRLEAYRFRRQLYYATCAILVSIPSSYSEGVRYPSPF